MGSIKVLLLVPPSKTHYKVPPLGLAYIATQLLGENIKVDILDSLNLGLNINQTVKQIIKISPEILGIQMFSYDFNNVVKIVREIKRQRKEMVIVVGGAHPSAIPKQTLIDIPEVDFAIQGEGEYSFLKLTKKILNKEYNFSEIEGLTYRVNNEIKSNRRKLIENLDDLGMPAWELVNPQNYKDAPQGVFYKYLPVAPISTSRGCPYQCTFCAGFSLMGRKLRTHSIEFVLEEIELLHKKYKVREFHIVDDTFTQLKERAIEFCEKIIEKKFNIVFTFPNGIRLDTLDEELVRMLKKAGCYSVILGIESGSQKILDDMKKRTDLVMIKEKIDLLVRENIKVRGFFIIGYPTETRYDIKRTIRFARSLPLRGAHFGNFLPLPGTEMTMKLQSSGKLNNLNWSDLFYSKVVVTPDGISKKELKNYQRWAYLSFYLRPKILFEVLKEVRSFEHFINILKRLKSYVFE